MAPRAFAVDGPLQASITLTPAVIMLEARQGQSATQTLTVDNRTNGRFAFEMEALDVTIRDGKRTFVQAGELPGGIARTAVFTPRVIDLQPGESTSVQVTVTVPENPEVRAIVALFHGTTEVANIGGIAMTGSIGALITFTLSKEFRVENISGGEIKLSPENSLTLLQSLINTGSEPVIPKGILAILNSAGGLVGKVAVSGQRLLPGETVAFKTDYPMPLKPGKYRALTSMKYEGKVLTTSADFVVP
ncbi:MAG TPA: hypothetical protein VH088_21770 [Terriglobales bacterium]|nr:hypothetical protein [Terriglobales bacterium]